MVYQEFHQIKLSPLGMGNMRLPTVGDKPEAPIDYTRAKEIIDYAMTNGVNYYDTAYVYHQGESEVFLGKALADYDRNSYYLATKFYMAANPDYRAVFEEQLARLQTDRIDFYLIHSVMDHTADDYLNSGCIDYFLEQQKAGRITYLGFSSHASPAGLEQFASHHQWDFAQIQLNYLDWLYSTSKEEYQILAKHNIPVVVMEPIRGGRLAILNDELAGKLKAQQPDWTPASWALRWVRRLSNVKVILSGMSTMEQLRDNLFTFAEECLLDEKQTAFLESIGREFKTSLTAPCTSCRYCCSDCPALLDIPELLRIYNAYRYTGWWLGRELDDIPAEQRPSVCLACGACVHHCPQSIDIPDIMKQLAGLAQKAGA